jgi:SAM-dependent methyltransferase
MKKHVPGEHDDEPDAIRSGYEQYGVRGFYERFGATYRNPHEYTVRQILRRVVHTWALDLRNVLDLACGSGEATLALQELGAQAIDGIDPYTAQAYFERTGKYAQPYTFEQIARGALLGRRYSLVVCSFALHLAQESWLPPLAQQLSLIAGTLVVITPHKRPSLRPSWGWVRQDELLIDRVRAHLYRRSYDADAPADM